MTMIERVARAMVGFVGHRDWGLMAVDRSDLRSRIKDGYDVNEPTQDDMMECARAAIKAMREMTPEMFDAAGFVHGADDVIPFWEQVIDAALENQPE